MDSGQDPPPSLVSDPPLVPDQEAATAARRSAKAQTAYATQVLKGLRKSKAEKITVLSRR